MTYELTNEEKISIVNSHLKNLELSIYNVSLSILEEESKSVPDDSSLTTLNSDLTNLNSRKAALLAELNSL